MIIKLVPLEMDMPSTAEKEPLMEPKGRRKIRNKIASEKRKGSVKKVQLLLEETKL